MAGVVSGAAEPRRWRPRGPGRHRGEPRSVRGVPRDARAVDARPPDGPPLSDSGRPRRLARDASPAWPGSGIRASRATPSTRSPRASWRAAAGCSPSSWPADARPAGPSSTRSRSRAGPRRSGASSRSSVHPPSTTHRQLDDAALAAAGITPGLLRCSVGLEDLDDLVADFARRSRPPGPWHPIGRNRRSHRRVCRGERPPPRSNRPPSDRSGGPSIASPATPWADTARPPTPDVFERIGRAVLRLFTSVDFAVVQIIALSILALVGMTIQQLPSFAFRSVGDYENAMADLHARYDPTLGRGIVDALERLQLFHVFTSTWFTLGLVVLVHLDRRLHARSDAPAVAPVEGDPGRPARRVLRPRAARIGRRSAGRRGGGPGGPPKPAVPRPRGRARRRPLPVRRPAPLDEARHAHQPPRADPVPDRGGRHVAVRRRAGPRRRRGRHADRPADRDARACCS